MSKKQHESVMQNFTDIGNADRTFPDFHGDRFAETMDALDFEDQLREVAKLPVGERRYALARLRAGLPIR